MPGEAQRRIAEGDREAALTHVKEAFVRGHLSHPAMDEHLQSALTAETPSDLERIITALPEEAAGHVVTLAGRSGRFRRLGAWRVPRTLRIESEFGRVNLDLSQAVFDYPVVSIELQLRFGRAAITVPRDAVVELDDLRAVWKQPVYKAQHRRGAAGPRIRICGSMEYGRLRVRHAAR